MTHMFPLHAHDMHVSPNVYGRCITIIVEQDVHNKSKTLNEVGIQAMKSCEMLYGYYSLAIWEILPLVCYFC